MSQLCVKDNYFVSLDTRSYHCFSETQRYVLYGSTNKLTDERKLEPLCQTCICKKLKVTSLNKIAVFSLKIILVLANSVDPDEMPHYVAFNLGLLCLHL